MKSARFPTHRHLTGFDFAASPVDEALILHSADLSFTEQTHNVVLIGGSGMGKTHLVTALGISGCAKYGKKVRFCSTVDLVNALANQKFMNKTGRIAQSVGRLDLVILDELGYLPFSQGGPALRIHLFAKLYELKSTVTEIPQPARQITI